MVLSRVRRLLGGVRSRLRSPWLSPGSATPSRPNEPLQVTGMVEQFSRHLVVGWVSVPEDAPAIRVDLYLGPMKVASTYSTAGESMSGVGSVLREGHTDSPRLAAERPSAASLVHTWQVPNVPGPPDDRRNSGRQIRTFSFRVRDIWPFVKRSTRISVRVGGHRLPIYGHGMFLLPPRSGKHSLAELQENFDEGYLFSQYGRLQLSKQLDTDWQRHVMRIYARTREILADELGYDIFFIYGTLLGVVREGGYIGHDVDFDSAFVSRHTDGPAAAEELVEIAMALIEHGLEVECLRFNLHIYDSDDTDVKVDLFHTYFDQGGVLQFPFGIAGTNPVTRDEWCGVREIEFPGGVGLVPENAERLVEHLYGADWRQPKPGFNWNLDRVARAVEGTLTEVQCTRVYWANFYARAEFTDGSTFFEFVDERSDIPRSILDIGCGDGRDSCGFGRSGRNVLGVDQSRTAVEHARAHAKRVGLTGRVGFEVCDIGDETAFANVLGERIAAADGAVLFYLRFLLHAIPQETQEQVMAILAKMARPGDMFAAEFRTDKDQEMPKVHGNHFRRFQNAAEFGRRLSSEYGFSILHEEEGTGLSPYRGEDPVLYRVVAAR